MHDAGHAHKALAEGVEVRLLVQPGVEGDKTLLSEDLFQSTKPHELIFSAIVGDDGTHNVRFERALCT